MARRILKHGRGRTKRRGVVVVQVAAILLVVLGFAALSVDVGAMYNAKADLQRTADAAALAAAGKLSAYDEGDPMQLAVKAALEIGEQNAVLGQKMLINPKSDVTFGRATLDEGSGAYEFTPNLRPPDAVKVRVRKTEDSSNDSLTLYFARVLGIHETDLEAEAVAVLIPRDIAVVADLSASHNDDSEFKHYEYGEINIQEVWDALPGGVGDVDSLWDADSLPPEWFQPDGSAPQASGPAWGFMQELGWGTEVIDRDYDPTSDQGMIELAYGSNWSDAQLQGFLADQGYLPTEVDAILDADYDGNGAYPYRVAVALGLAFWNSGHPGGLWEQRGVPAADAGNGNNWVGNSELEWSAQIFDKSMEASADYWLEYINSYMNQTYTQLYKAHEGFKYRFGVKSFTNFLLERKSSNGQTPEFSQTPTQPMQAVKDAVNYLAGMIGDLHTSDQLSLEVYGTTGRHEVDLTLDYTLVATRMNELQSGHYDGWTNMGGGLQRGIEELNSHRVRSIARKVIFLLTDGNANVTESGEVGNYSGGAAYALDRAEAAAAGGIQIYTISVGAGSNQALMQQIANIGDGSFFHAGGSTEQYSAELKEIFRKLGGERPVQLIH